MGCFDVEANAVRVRLVVLARRWQGPGGRPPCGAGCPVCDGNVS